VPIKFLVRKAQRAKDWLDEKNRLHRFFSSSQSLAL